MEPCPALTRDEADLLIACARACGDDASRSQVAVRLAAPLDWDALSAAASAHGVIPLLHAALASAGWVGVPATTQARLRAAARANVHHALFLAAQLVRLLEAFAREGLTAIPFKGPVLAATAYGDLTLRQFTDLDLFVRKAEMRALARCMLAEGYRSDTQDGGAATERALAADGDVAYRGPSYYPFYRPDGRCRVDLQWRMADRHFAFSLDDARSPWTFEDVAIAGRRVRTFSATDTLLILCVHGAKHGFEELKWICDVAQCVRMRGEAIDWRALQRKAAALHAGRMVGLGLALAHDMLGAPLPADVARRLRADRALVGLVQERRATLFGAPESSEAPRLVFYLRTKDGWGDRARFCATYARQFLTTVVTPSARDTAWVALPPRLRPLYYVLRPLRALRDCARGANRLSAPSSRRAPEGASVSKPREGARP